MPHYDDEQLNKLQETLANRLTKQDFLTAFNRVLEVVARTQRENSEAIKRLESLTSSIINKLQKDHEMSRSELKRLVSEGFMGDEFRKLSSLSLSAIKKLEKGLSALQEEASKASRSAKMSELSSISSIERVAEAKNAVLAMQSVKQAVELQIKELKEEVEKLRDTRSNRPMGRAKVPMTRFLDLTSEVDGSATQFTLPPDTVRVYAVLSTQFPQIWNTTDWSFSGRTLTLNFTLQEGQSLIVVTESLFYP